MKACRVAFPEYRAPHEPLDEGAYRASRYRADSRDWCSAWMVSGSGAKELQWGC